MMMMNTNDKNGVDAGERMLTCSNICNCNWGTCIASPTRRPRAHHRVNAYPGAFRQNETEMFSDYDETCPSIAAVSSVSHLWIAHCWIPHSHILHSEMLYANIL